MELLEKVLQQIWGKQIVRWINVEEKSLGRSDDLGSQIVRIRLDIGEEAAFNGPIILYGYRSFEDLLRSEVLYPRALVSSGVYYLRLPISLEDFKSIQSRSLNMQLDLKEVRKELQE
jgi:hypothetical protein